VSQRTQSRSGVCEILIGDNYIDVAADGRGMGASSSDIEVVLNVTSDASRHPNDQLSYSGDANE
jgi:hypothetical protein